MTLRSMVRGAAERVMCALPRRTRPGDRLILAYHNVVPADWAPRGDRSLHLPIDKFEAQLRMIHNEAEIVPLMELLTTEAPKDRRVAITFDDAYASALELGVGACVSESMPCTIFVTPGLLGTVPYWDRAADAHAWSPAHRHAFLWADSGRQSVLPEHEGTLADARLSIASELHLRSVSTQYGVSVGNHTMSHPNLGALTSSEILDELTRARDWLQNFCPDSVVPAVAFPFGIGPETPVPPTVTDQFPLGLLASGGWAQFAAAPLDWRIPRWNVPRGLSEHGFAIRLRGRLRESSDLPRNTLATLSGID